MPITLGSNIASLTAQRRLGDSTDALTRVFERLSSGQRINRASDDAAGLAVADSLRADSRIYSQAIRNANDGISMLSIQESALQAVSGIATRISELAEQAANGVYSSKQRIALNTEAQALWSEAIRISETTKFNGISLLSGTQSSVQIQVGNDSRASAGITVQTGSDLFRETTYAFDGTLSNGGAYDVQGRAEYVNLSDFNGDGILDALVGGTSSSAVNILIGNGDGSFKVRVTYGGYNSGTSVGDVDNDRDLDIVYITGTGVLATQKNSGNGTFSLTLGADLDANGIGYLHDVDSDGVVDWLSIDSTNDKLWVVAGNGDGTFKTAVSLAVGSNILSGSYGDLNEDGHLDVLVTGSAEDKVFLGNADGTFSAPITIADSLAFGRLVDLNGDGHLDIVGMNAGSSFIHLNIGNGNGTFKVAQSVYDDGSYALPVFGDINDDGLMDMVRSDISGDVYLNLGNGNGSFKARLSTNTGVSNTTGFPSALGDLDGDGVPDIVAGTYNAASLVSVLSGSSPSTSALSFSLLTASDARTTLETFSNVQERVARDLGKIGASQSRLEIALRNTEAAKQNYLAAESRIRDADIASESSSLVRQQILQRAATAVLAQANQQPALALQLLS